MKNRIILFALASFLVSCAVSPVVEIRLTDRTGQDTVVTIKLKCTSSGVLCGKDCYRLELQQEDLAETAFLKIIPEFGKASEGDDGFFLNAEGLMSKFSPRTQECSYRTEYNDVGIAGYKCGKECWVGVLKSLDLECRETIFYSGGKYEFSLDYDIGDCGVYEPLIVDFYPLKGKNASYSGMARLFRKYLLSSGKMPAPIRERVKTDSCLAYAVEAPEIRVRQAWKPAPSPIPHQTIDNEPPLHVALTFRQVGDIVAEFERQGIDKAEFCLVGWKLRGHDGRDPDIFPVEEALGGESELRKLICNSRDKGYQIVGHTNHTDIYSISKEWNDGAPVCKNADGSLQRKWRYSGGLMYNLCYAPSYEFYLRDEPKVAELGFHGLEFVDVMALVTPHECYDPAHPLNRRQAAEYANRMLDGLRGMFGGSQSEGCHYFAARSVDFAMYSSMKMDFPRKKEIIDSYVPLWQIVFHGYILSNPASETVNYNIKSPEFKLRFIEAGGRPLYYFYSKFMSNGNNWMGDKDLSYESPEDLQNSVKVIKDGYEEYRKLSHLQYETLDDHCEIAPGVTRSIFSDGTQIVCNYTGTPFVVNGQIIGAENYFVFEQ
ncbi:MAG: hypothetical protein IJQ93_09665 [Bacteroidales bacterium]|nr:hypothetical protein [Bacteroidales bacterium]